MRTKREISMPFGHVRFRPKADGVDGSRSRHLSATVWKLSSVH
jgi:hypothetical protein